MDGAILGPEQMVAVDDKPKAVLIDGGTYLMVSPERVSSAEGVRWRTTPRHQLKKF
jgi:hypothetical protein